MPKKMMPFLLGGAIFVVIAVMILISSCSIGKSEKKEAETGTEVVEEDQKGVSIEPEEKEVVKEEKEVEEKEIPKKEVVETPKKPQAEKGETPSGVMEEVSVEPQLGKEVQTSVLISKKSIFHTSKGSFAYALGLVVPNEDGSYSTVDYFCSRKTYDGVATGESVKIGYQSDEYGTISITSIAKD